MRAPTLPRSAYLLFVWMAICASVAIGQDATDAGYPGAYPHSATAPSVTTPQSQPAPTATMSSNAVSPSVEPWNQIERLPPILAPPAQLLEPAPKYGDNFTSSLLLPDDPDPAGAAYKKPPPGLRRAGFFQGINLGGAWLATGGGHDALGIAESRVDAEFALPSPIRQSVILIKPGFGVHRFDCPGGYDVPDDVYDASVAFGLRGHYSERLAYQFSVAVGSYSDFENSSSQQVRLRGYGLALWKWTRTVDLTVGVAYTDLEDWPVLPLGGLVIRPDDRQEWEITFPRMAYSRRLEPWPVPGVTLAPRDPEDPEYWGSVGLELGGGCWRVQTWNDTTDNLTYRDWRLTLGLQRKQLHAYDLNFEVGYVFARRIEYEDDHESFAPDDTVSLTLTGRF
jgi:hypothetical protein